MTKLSEAERIGRKLRTRVLATTAVVATLLLGSLAFDIWRARQVMLDATQDRARESVVEMSLARDQALASWRADTARRIAIDAAILALLFAVAALMLRAFAAQQRAQVALAQSQRLEAIGLLTGGVAHDFNNVMTVILGNAYLLQQSLPASPASGADEAREAVDQIEQAAKRAAELTRRLLAVARRQPLQPRVLDVGEVVRSLAPIAKRLLGEAVELRLEVPGEPLRAELDRAQLETTLINLVANARDATRAGGWVRLAVSPSVLSEATSIQETELAPGRYITLEVEDNGEGIAPQHLPHLFEPFFTTKAPGIGTGLGLSTAYGFVRQSGGAITVSSQQGVGTTLRLSFPEAPLGTGVAGRSGFDTASEFPTPFPRVGQEPVPGIETDAPPGASGAKPTHPRILLVEDEPGVRRLSRMVLAHLGYEVIEAEDASEALAAERDAGRIDLLFTDLVLPGQMNGLALAEEMARRRPGLRVLFTSGYSREILAHRHQVDPSLRLISKPYDRRQLATAIDGALRGEARTPSGEWLREP